MIDKICQWLAKRLPSLTIPDSNGNPYLTRYYFFGKDRYFGNIYLHHFHASDSDTDKDGTLLFHSHPWGGLSLILTGGYVESRAKEDGSVSLIRYHPGALNVLGPNTYHRVDLLENDAWSLFFTGPRSSKRDWFFWNHKTKQKINWRTKVGAIG